MRTQSEWPKRRSTMRTNFFWTDLCEEGVNSMWVRGKKTTKNDRNCFKTSACTRTFLTSENLKTALELPPISLQPIKARARHGSLQPKLTLMKKQAKQANSISLWVKTTPPKWLSHFKNASFKWWAKQCRTAETLQIQIAIIGLKPQTTPSFWTSQTRRNRVLIEIQYICRTTRGDQVSKRVLAPDRARR